MEDLSELQKIITEDLPKLVEQLKSEINDREDSDNTMLKKFSEEVHELSKELDG
jgi:sugar-specific transcriptional regulator TrmB